AALTQRLEDEVEVVGGDPVGVEAVRDPQHHLPTLDALELDRLEPRLEVLFRQPGSQRRESGIPQVLHHALSVQLNTLSLLIHRLSTASITPKNCLWRTSETTGRRVQTQT